jgi:hypothetical protein
MELFDSVAQDEFDADAIQGCINAIKDIMRSHSSDPVVRSALICVALTDVFNGHLG